LIQNSTAAMTKLGVRGLQKKAIMPAMICFPHGV
jgi:hypothetical protein